MNDPAAEMLVLPVTVPVVVLVAQLMFPPESVSVVVMEIEPPFVLQSNGSCVVACVSAPEFVHELAPSARLLLASLNPLSVKLAIVAATLTVIVHAAAHDAASIVTASEEVGAAHPLFPPVIADQCAVSFQFPVPAIQNRLAGHDVSSSAMMTPNAVADVPPQVIVVPVNPLFLDTVSSPLVGVA